MAEHPNESTAIRNIQRYLRQLSFHDSDIIPVPIDGVWGKDTEQALSAFQLKNGLPLTGSADLETFEKLYAAYLQSLITYAIPGALNIFPRLPDNFTVLPGDSTFLVKVIQFLLQELSVSYDDLGDLEQTGIYDAATERAVRSFQHRNRLEETGLVGRFTWNRLVSEYDKVNLDTSQ